MEDNNTTTLSAILKSLGFWIFFAMIIGIVVGIFMGSEASVFAPLGALFIQLIKMLVVPLVGVSIVSGAAALGDSKSAGKIGVVSISYILITTFIAVGIAFIAGNIFTPGRGIDAEIVSSMSVSADNQAPIPVMTFWDTVLGIIPANPIAAFAEGNILQIIFFSLMLGFGISALKTTTRQKVVNGLNAILEALIWCINKIMLIAPIGVFGLMAEATGSFGFSVMVSIMSLFVVNVIAAVVMMVLYPLSVSFSKVPVKTFLKSMLKPQLIAFSSSSSLVTLPVNMEVCEKELGLSKETTGFVLPLGATINMCGNAIYYTLVALFFAQFYGIDLSISQYVSIAIVVTVGSIGQAGVPGPTLLVAAVLVAAGIPIDGLPLLYALDRIFDMLRTVVNITGDAACACFTDSFVNREHNVEA